MLETFEGKGSCLCGRIQFRAPETKLEMGVCHCNTCRQWAGGPLMLADCGEQVIFNGNEVEYLKSRSSSFWGERSFCTHCGSHIFYKIKGSQHHYMAVGLFDKNPPFILHHQLFIDKQPCYYEFAGASQRLTARQAKRKYLPQLLFSTAKYKLKKLKTPFIYDK